MYIYVCVFNDSVFEDFICQEHIFNGFGNHVACQDKNKNSGLSLHTVLSQLKHIKHKGLPLELCLCVLYTPHLGIKSLLSGLN